MRRLKLMIGLVLVGLTSAPVGAVHADDASAPRIVLPIKQTPTKEGNLYSIPISFGSTTLDAVLDTGSTGLHVLSDVLPAASIILTDQKLDSSYANGEHLGGVFATATLTLGGMTKTAVPIEDVKVNDCIAAVPKCPAAASDRHKPGILGGSFTAIVGASMPPPGFAPQLSNPLLSFGTSWIVILPPPGTKAYGQLIINPTAADRAGFVAFPGGTGGSVGGGRANPVPGCIKNEGSGRSFCGPVVLDTGAPMVHVITDEFAQARTWTPGSKVLLSFNEPSGGTLAETFAVDPKIMPTRVALGRFPEIGQKPTRVLAGAEPFFKFEVLYDTAANIVGLKAR